MENHNTEQDRRMNNIEESVKTINHEMGEVRDNIADVKIDVAKVKTDVAWLKRTYWVVVSASVGALIVGLIQLLEHK